MTKIMTLSEVADYLHISRMTTYKMVRSGELPPFRIGSDWRFTVEAIDRWRAEKENADRKQPSHLTDLTAH